MVFLDLAGLQLFAGSREKLVKLQEMYNKLSKRSALYILFRAVTVVPMHTSIHSAADLHNNSVVNQGTLPVLITFYGRKLK